MEITNRYRTETYPTVVFKGTTYKKTLSTGYEILEGSADYNQQSGYKFMTDCTVDNYYRRSRFGEIIINPMNSLKVTETQMPTVGTTWSPVNNPTTLWTISRPYCSSVCVNFSTRPASWDAEMDDLKTLVATEAKAKMNSNDVLLPVTLGEMHETIDMFKKCMNSLAQFRKCIDLARHRLYGVSNADGAITISRALEDAWMEMRFGWRPFYHDVKNYGQIVERMNFKHLERLTFRSARVVNNRMSEDVRIIKDSRTFYFQRGITETVTIRSGSIGQMMAEGFKDTFGLTKMPQVIWELTPLSWAVDYFCNFNQVLQSSFGDTLWQDRGQWLSVRRLTHHWKRYIDSTRSNYGTALRDGTHDKIMEYYDRVKNPSNGFVFRFNLDFAKLLDVSVLAEQFLFRKSLKKMQKQMRRLERYRKT